MTRKHFKVSSALKNIIGKDLITDDFVAIFELVKNSFDANAKRVDVVFEKTLSDDGRIIISDNGKGMDLKDIEEKWLFVAYSAKKEGVEDYRDEIKTKRIHAGAKGIGRFSCDRLGKVLTIYSRRSTNEKISKLTVEWEAFEKSMQKKFENIPVEYELIDSCEHKLTKGTVLEIANVRSVWDAFKLRKLRQSLEKLINPSQSNVKTPFSIYLKAEEFKPYDSEAKKNGQDHEVINGKVNNFLFEKLDLKSTSIKVDIDKKGELITTELFDKGQFVYRMAEENPYKTENWTLSNIRVHLFAMNQTSKSMFTKYMGVRPVQFGSVFVYKNGFRIHPIGEIGRGDVFGLDGRKQQGTSRFFGTRDLVGRVEIDGDNEEFREASSRDGGLERNEAFIYLQDFFIDHVLKRLERFAIGVVKYGNIDEFDVHDLSSAFPKEKALEFIEALTKSDSIHDIEFNPDIFDIVSNASEKSLNTLLKNLSRIASDSDSPELDGEISKIESRLKDFSKATKDAEKEAREEKKRRREAEEAARDEAEKARAAEQEAQAERDKSALVTKQSIFLRSMVSSDLENVVSLHHHIGIAAGTIENYVRAISKKIRSGKPMTAESFLTVLDEISFVARQISATTKFATKANFNLEAELIEQDLYGYIQEYVMNVCSGLVKVDKKINLNMDFQWQCDNEDEFIIKFRPLEVAMVLDSLINNSVKAGAKKVVFDATIENNELTIIVSDNGKGIKDSIKDKIYEMGFTTTNGSGLGLHHTKSILQGMEASIALVDGASKGSMFKLTFTR